EKQQECVRCHADCASCEGPGFDDCDVCRNSKAVRYNGECLAHCPMNAYYDKTINECRANFSFSVFTLCLFPSDSTCVKECPVGYYAEDKDERVCERCHFSCKSCVGSHSVQCTTCKPGFFRQGSSCVETCSESHFGNTITMVCEHCDPSCSQCWGHGNRKCLSCRGDYLYLSHWGQCLKSCPPNYYHDSWSKNCHRCHPTCKTCSGKENMSWLISVICCCFFPTVFLYDTHQTDRMETAILLVDRKLSYKNLRTCIRTCLLLWP
uniref:Furin-like cysteine-rich domain-containing protein n=1 Tax=Seriola dumerili TaxID=41447 RepID=A0A3B4VEU9_SERDU